MSQTLLALLCALRCSHLVAVRPQDGFHKELGNVHHASDRVGGLKEVLAVGRSATLQRAGDRKRLHHSDHFAPAAGASGHHAEPGDSVGAKPPSVKPELHPKDADPNADTASHAPNDPPASEGVPSTDDLTKGSHVDSKSSADEKTSADDQKGAVQAKSPSPESADEKNEVDSALKAQTAQVDSKSSADEKNVAAQNVAVPLTSPSPESADAKKEGVQTNSPSDATTLAPAQKGLTEGQAGAAPTHKNEQQAAVPVALTTNDDLSDSIPEKSPVAVLVGDVTVGTMKDNDKDGQAEQQLDDIIWDVQELQRIAWSVGARLGTFYKDEAYRHIIVNVIVYLAGVFIALGLYFMCFQHREVSTEQEFRYGLCECFGDVRVSLCGIFCPAIRWADTVSEEKGGFLSFSYALVLMMGLGLLAFRPIIGVFAWVAIVIIGVYYRQRIREKYGLESDTTPSLIEDFFVWCCCSYCALVQEARQVDDFEGRKNSEYTEESEDFKTGTLKLSQTDTGTSW